jgi:hypothetical protein
MKKHKNLFGIVSIVLGLLLLAGCPGVFGPESSGQENSEPEGTGEQRVTFLINTLARTLLPETPGFDKYSLAFTANDGQALPEENPVEIDGNSDTILLAPGSWTVTVRGLVHFENIPGIADGYYEGAVSEPKTFNVGFSATTVNIAIRGGIQSGVKGLFSYAVSFPAEVTSGELRLLDLDEQPITGLDPVDLLPQENRSGTMALNPGYYLLQVALENASGSHAYKTEVLHIYSSLTTTANSSNGYAFTAEQFAPISELSGQVALTTAGLDNTQTCTLFFYRDSGYAHLIGSTELAGDGSWSFRISSYYTSVYLKAHIYYTGYPLLELTKGPVAVTSTDPADWAIDAGLLELSGTVQLDTVVTIESNTTPTLSLYSDSAYTALVKTVNVNTTTGAWNAVILPAYTNVYLKATVDYDGFDAFDWKKGPVAAASTTAADWIINAGLLRLSGTVQLDTVVTTDITPALSLYSDSAYAVLIETVNVNTTTGAWNVTLLPEHANVYLKAAVDYDGFDAFDWKKGPVAVASTTAADWIINAGLLRLSGTVQLDAVVTTDATPTLSLYSDSAYANLIETANVNTTTGAWNVTLLPEYTNVYLKATVDYDGYNAFDWKKGPVAAASTTTVDWKIDTRLPRVTGTLPLVLTNDVPGLPTLTVKVYSDAGYTTAIQHGGSDLSAPVTASFGDTSGDFKMVIPPSVSETNPPLYFKTHYSASSGLANPEDYTITGGTGIWTGSLSPGSNVLSLSALSIAGSCELTTAVINDSYGNQAAYGSGSVTSGTPNDSGKYKGSITVTATPNSGYVFVKWVAANDRTAPVLSTNASYTFTIQSDTTLYAVFNGTGTSTSVPAIEVWETGTIANGAYLTDTTDAPTSGTLNGMRNGLDKHYKLIKDITLTGTWTSTNTFSGTLDGNGKTITFDTGSSLAIAGTYAGIFNSILSSGVVKDLTVAGTIPITGNKLTRGGAIVGYLSQGTIQRCAVTGSINADSVPNYSGSGESGGLGGIAGYMFNGTIEASYVTGEVRALYGSDYQWISVGGIVGYIDGTGTVKHCYTTGTVRGGRAVSNTGLVVEGRAGGIAGSNRGGGIVEYCYALGSIFGGTYLWPGIAGGIVGLNNSKVEHCVALNSSVSGGSTNAPSAHRVVGNNDGGSLSNNYGKNGLLSSVTNNGAGVDGATVNLANTQVQTWWFNSGGVFYSYDGTSVTQPWVWNAADQRPSLYWEN